MFSNGNSRGGFTENTHPYSEYTTSIILSILIFFASIPKDFTYYNSLFWNKMTM